MGREAQDERKMMGRRQKLDGDGWDVVSQKARRLLCWVKHPGVTRRVKTRLNRLERRQAKREIMDCKSVK